MRSSSVSTASVLALLSCCALLCGCTSVTHLQPSSRPPETSLTTPGAAPTYTVEVVSLTNEFTTQLERLPTFLLSVTNNQTSPVTFSTSNVTAYSGNRPIRVYDPFDLAKRLQNDAKFKTFVTAARGQAQIEAAQYSQLTAGKGAVISVRTKALTDTVAAQKDAFAELARATRLLFPYPIAPGGTAVGTVVLHAEDIAPDQPLTLTVTVGAEKHTFFFDIRS